MWSLENCCIGGSTFKTERLEFPENSLPYYTGFNEFSLSFVPFFGFYQAMANFFVSETRQNEHTLAGNVMEWEHLMFHTRQVGARRGLMTHSCVEVRQLLELFSPIDS